MDAGRLKPLRPASKSSKPAVRSKWKPGHRSTMTSAFAGASNGYPVLIHQTLPALTGGLPIARSCNRIIALRLMSASGSELA